MLPTMLLAIQTAQREREIEDFELAYREAMAKSNASKGSKKPSLGKRRFRACLSRSDSKGQRDIFACEEENSTRKDEKHGFIAGVERVCIW